MEIKSLKSCRCFLNEIADWHYHEWQHLYPADTIHDFIEDLKQSLADTAVPGTWVLMDENKPVGSASIVRHDMETNRHLSPWLANVFIKPEYRGKGLGRILINHVQEQARSIGVAEIYLFTENRSKLYKSLGWRTVKHEKYHQNDVEVMMMQLKSQDAG